jgi:hypothetical protein
MHSVMSQPKIDNIFKLKKSTYKCIDNSDQNLKQHAILIVTKEFLKMIKL